MSGTVTVSVYETVKLMDIIGTPRITFKLACVGDASDGSVPSTQIPTTLGSSLLGMSYDKCGLWLTEVSVVDGLTTPDLADITITDALGRTLFTESDVIPASGANYGTVSTYYAVNSALTVAVSNQSTPSALFDIYITLAM